MHAGYNTYCDELLASNTCITHENSGPDWTVLHQPQIHSDNSIASNESVRDVAPPFYFLPFIL